MNKKKIRDIYQALLQHHGPRNWWPIIAGEKPKDGARIPANDHQRLEICVGAILTQNTNWKNVTIALKSLASHDLFSVEKLLKTPEEEIAFAIKSAGYYNQKTKYLKNLTLFLNHNPFKELRRRSKDRVRRSLLELKGIGPETADSILLYALDKLSFVVDAYTMRMFSHLNIIEPKSSYHSVQKLFESSLTHDLEIFREYHALIVRHGKEFYSRKPYGAKDGLLTDVCGV